MAFLRQLVDAYHRRVVSEQQLRHIDRRLEDLRRREEDCSLEIEQLEAAREQLEETARPPAGDE